MIARSGQKICRLLLRGWRLPEKTGNRVRVSSFSKLCEFEAVFGSARRVDILGCRDNVGVENLNLGWLAWRSRQAEGCAYKVVSILKVAADSNLAGTVPLGSPFAPIKGIHSPRCEIIAGARLGVNDVVAHAAGGGVRHARVGAGTNVGQAQWRVGDVALGAGRAVLVGIGRRDKLRRGAARRGRSIGMVRGGRGSIVAGGGAGARVAMGQAQRRLADRGKFLHRRLLLGLRLLGEAVLRRH